MKGKAKLCNFMPQFTNNMQKLCKKGPFSAIKHLFRFKEKRSKIDVSAYESVQQVGVSWSMLSGFWVFLCTFMKVCMTYERFCYFWHFWPFWGLFGAKTWSKWDQNWTKIGPKLDQNRSVLGDLWPFLGRSRVILGSLRDHFGIILGSFWCRFDPILRHLLGRFWAFFLGTFLGPF